MHCIPICITAIKNEDDREFMQILYTRHESLMYRTALRMIHDHQDVDDAVSAACESLIRGLQRIRQVNPKVYPAYIMTAVRNQALMLRRRRGIEQRAYEHLMEQNGIQKDHVTPDLDAQLYYRHALVEVMEAISGLSIDDQTILRLKFFDKLPDAEIAEMLDIQPSTVRSKVMRARRRLRAAMKEKEDDK